MSFFWHFFFSLNFSLVKKSFASFSHYISLSHTLDWFIFKFSWHYLSRFGINWLIFDEEIRFLNWNFYEWKPVYPHLYINTQKACITHKIHENFRKFGFDFNFQICLMTFLRVHEKWWTNSLEYIFDWCRNVCIITKLIWNRWLTNHFGTCWWEFMPTICTSILRMKLKNIEKNQSD
jgi:hypothetical protein